MWKCMLLRSTLAYPDQKPTLKWRLAKVLWKCYFYKITRILDHGPMTSMIRQSLLKFESLIICREVDNDKKYFR